MSGKELIQKLSEATSLPDELISMELINKIEESGMDPKSVNLEDIRGVLVEYLQDVILKAKKIHS